MTTDGPPSVQEAPDEWLSRAEAATSLGVHYMTAYRYVRTGRLDAEQCDNGSWRVARRSLPRVHARRRVRSAQPATGRRPSLDGRSEQLEHALLNGDEPTAWLVVEQALSSGSTPTEVIEQMLGPAMRRIGDGWAAGRLTVGDEHLATTSAVRVLARLSPLTRTPGRYRGTVLVGAPASELHSLPAALFGETLRTHGFNVRNLGADTPPNAFAHAAARLPQRSVVAISATTAGNDAVIRATVAAIPLATTVPIVLGGAAIASAEHAAALGADHHATTTTAAAVLDELLRTTADVTSQPQPTN